MSSNAFIGYGKIKLSGCHTAAAAGNTATSKRKKGKPPKGGHADEGSTWCATEKVHGANFAIHVDVSITHAHTHAHAHAHKHTYINTRAYAHALT